MKYVASNIAAGTVWVSDYPSGKMRSDANPSGWTWQQVLGQHVSGPYLESDSPEEIAAYLKENFAGFRLVNADTDVRSLLMLDTSGHIATD